MKEYFRLLRPQQWYKNLVVFLPIIFALRIFEIVALEKTLIGFASLCLISSVNYIINDVADLKKDRLHPEKNKRPLASRKVSLFAALIISIVLLIASVSIASYLSVYFAYFVLLIFVLTQIYTFWLKKEVFADILCIGINFVLRAVSGAFVIVAEGKPYVTVSPWLIVGTFFLALFLLTGKREADLTALGEDASKHKEVLGVYNEKITNSLMIISTALLIVSYTLYSFLSQYPKLIYTLPVALYLIFRYFYFVKSGSEIARHPEKVFKDKRMIIGIFLWSMLTFFILY